ncbi:MAG: hypothetical protein V2A73_07615 [Pseudomonadota bacterium]
MLRRNRCQLSISSSSRPLLTALASCASLALLGIVASIGCNPYDPNLGEEPFRCGTDIPRCPSGYHDVTIPQPELGVAVCECHRGPAPELDAIHGQADAMPDFSCKAEDDKTFTGDPDGNESIEEAAPTRQQFSQTDKSWSQSKLTICPYDDIDVFAVPMPEATPTLLEVRMIYEPSFGALAMSILDKDNKPIAEGSAVGSEKTGELIAKCAPTNGATYYVRISAHNRPNGYDLAVSLQW